MRRLLAGVVALFLAATPVFAQSGTSVRQSGSSVNPNTVPAWVTNGVIGGSVSAADSPVTSFGVTTTSSAGNCVNSARQAAGGWVALCLGFASGIPTISVQNNGSASAQPLQFVVNGTTFPFPGGLAGLTVNGTTIASGSVNGVLFNSGGLLGNLATLSNGVLVTSGAGTPSIATTLPSGLTIPSPTFTGNNFITLANMPLVNAFSLWANPTNLQATAQQVTLDPTLVFSGTTLKCATSAGTQNGCVHPDGTTITVNGLGSITAVGAATTSVDAGGATSVTNGNTNGQSCLYETAAGKIGVVPCPLPSPGGRLTVSSGVPVMVSAANNQTTLYYAPYQNPYVPIYNGTNMQSYQFTSSTSDTVGLSLVLGANWSSNTLYDAFVALNAGVPVLCTGPAWSSATARAATGGLSLLNGFQTNTTNNMVCRISNSATITCSSFQCTYVGTVLTDASNAGQISWTPGASGAGGVAARLSIWNAANRVMVRAQVTNSTASWTYTTGTPREINGSTTMNVAFVSGQQVDGSSGTFSQALQMATTAGAFFEDAMALDSTSVNDHAALMQNPASGSLLLIETVSASYPPQLGSHAVNALETGDGTHATTALGGTNGFGQPNCLLEFSMLM